ncbi:hypothetical protein LCGC14_2429090 [marine sediment metagenome]|uniref:Uncharacterized protein n=1 Tax=marine sediment metagenome TaxID=412755 RepID=A0A0F9DZF6_9ZZZZ
MRQWILLVVLMLMVSGCTTAAWQGAGRGMMVSLGASMQGLSVAMREAGNQKIVSAFTYTGNHHAEYIRAKQLRRERAMAIMVYCMNNVSSRYEYNSCLSYNGVD